MNGAAHDVHDRLAELRRDGTDRMDPLRFERIDALARRAARLQGGLRTLLDARLAELVDAYVAGLAPASSRPEDPPARPGPVRHGAGAMALLLGQFDRERDTPGATGPGTPVASPHASATHLDEAFRISAQARTESQLRQALDDAPEDAGPLNSASLVHRALNLMRDVSPGYLEAFMRHVDALAWLEALALPDGPAAAQPAGRATGTTRSRTPRKRRAAATPNA